MTTDENKNNPEQKETVLDFGKLKQDMRKHKKNYFLVLGITFVLGVIYLLSLHNVYKCEVMLAPELSRSSSSNSLLSLANSFGMRIGSSTSSGEALFLIYKTTDEEVRCYVVSLRQFITIDYSGFLLVIPVNLLLDDVLSVSILLE